MSLCFLTIFAPIVELIKGKKSLRWRKRNKLRQGGEDNSIFLRRDCRRLESMRNPDAANLGLESKQSAMNSGTF
jgi:hypothetical protein